MGKAEGGQKVIFLGSSSPGSGTSVKRGKVGGPWGAGRGGGGGPLSFTVCPHPVITASVGAGLGPAAAQERKPDAPRFGRE